MLQNLIRAHLDLQAREALRRAVESPTRSIGKFSKSWSIPRLDKDYRRAEYQRADWSDPLANHIRGRRARIENVSEL